MLKYAREGTDTIETLFVRCIINHDPDALSRCPVVNISRVRVAYAMVTESCTLEQFKVFHSLAELGEKYISPELMKHAYRENLDIFDYICENFNAGEDTAKAVLGALIRPSEFGYRCDTERLRESFCRFLARVFKENRYTLDEIDMATIFETCSPTGFEIADIYKHLPGSGVPYRVREKPIMHHLLQPEVFGRARVPFELVRHVAFRVPNSLRTKSFEGSTALDLALKSDDDEAARILRICGWS